MAINLLWPAYVLLNFHSANGTHGQTIPTREWSPTPLVPLNKGGSYTNWSGLPCDGQTMVEEMATNLSAFNPATTVYDHATIYTLATPESPAIPRAGWALSIAGSNATPGWSKAVQRAWIFRDTAWKICKLYQLDTGSADTWNAVTDITGNAPALAIVGAFTNLSWAWSSRFGERPNTFMKATVKLNDELRKQYNMA